MFTDFGCLQTGNVILSVCKIQKGVQNENSFEDRHQNAPCLRSFSTCFFVYIQLSCIFRFQNDRGRMVPPQYRNRLGQKPSVCPQFLVVYFGCYLFWAVNYILIARQERHRVYQFLQEIFVKMYLPCLFLVYPTTNTRPVITDAGLWNQAALWLYSVDSADKSVSVNPLSGKLVLLSWHPGNQKVPVWYQRVSMVIAVLVFVSTLLTKQHVIADVAGGVILAELCFCIGRKTELYRIYENLAAGLSRKS